MQVQQALPPTALPGLTTQTGPETGSHTSQADEIQSQDFC